MSAQNNNSNRTSVNLDERRAAPATAKGKGATQHTLPPEKLADAERFIRLPEVTAITGLGGSTIYELMRAKAFPQNIMLSGRLVVWDLREILCWREAKIAARNDVADRKASKRRAGRGNG